jgi:tRNA 2-selenouridine synthase
MSDRVKLWREDFAHFVSDPLSMVQQLTPLKPLVGGEELKLWLTLAEALRVDELFERVMTNHYDPCYARSTRRSYRRALSASQIQLASLSSEYLAQVASELAARDDLETDRGPSPLISSVAE